MAKEETSDSQGTAVREPGTAEDNAKAAVEHDRKPAASDYQIVHYYYDLACEALGLPDHVREVMGSAYREISVQVPVRLVTPTRTWPVMSLSNSMRLSGRSSRTNACTRPSNSRSQSDTAIDPDAIRPDPLLAFAKTAAAMQVVSSVPLFGAQTSAEVFQRLVSNEPSSGEFNLSGSKTIRARIALVIATKRVRRS